MSVGTWCDYPLTRTGLIFVLSLVILAGCIEEAPLEAPVGRETQFGNYQCSTPKPPGAACNPFCQDCGVGKHCAVVGESLRCIHTGDRFDGESCNSADQCGSGLSCFALGDAAPACQRVCGNSSGCRSGAACAYSITLEGGLSLDVCGEPRPACDMRVNDCAAGTECLLTSNEPRCGMTGSLPAGAPCRHLGAGSCMKGLQCIVACTPICTLEDKDESRLPACSEVCGEWALVYEAQGLGVCTDGSPRAECQVLSPDCALGEACYALSAGWMCAKKGKVSNGGACTETPQCEEGYVCAENRCRPVCFIDSTGDDGCGVRCPSEYSQLPPVSWGLGICL